MGKLGQKIIIVDARLKERSIPGKVGEIWIRGLNVSQGYWESPIETKKTFRAYLANGEGPYLRTGDLGFISNKDLFITGRLNEMIIIRGRNHYPQDIESTVQRCHPALTKGGGASFLVEKGGFEQLVVVQEVERKYLRKLDVDSVIKQIRRTISDHHGVQVTEIVLVRPGSVLRTSSGKVRRLACRTAFLAGGLQLAA